jgi:hypothetical protein
MRNPRLAFFARSLIVVFIALLMQAAFALDTTDPSKAFVGTWQAQFQGKPFVTIKLEEQDGKLAGTISHANTRFDDHGELSSAEAQDGEDKFVEVKVAGKIAHLTSKDANGENATQYEIELGDPNQAELRFVALPSNTQAPKPFKLEKLTAALAKPASMKDKLTAAAQIWMSGQFGNNTANASGANAASGNAAASGATTASVVPALKVSEATIDPNLCKAIDALPRRINDQFKNLGDMVNFVLVGSKDQVQTALESANWHLADTDSKESALKAVLETYQKKDYMSMPMSRLYLFDRVQDFGYEQGEAYAVVASRHHFRLWKAPFTLNDQPVWVGAGTHDIGFEKDQRNGKVTHKIDPAVDGERDNIGATLQKADKVKSMSYYLPPEPVQDARNATGGGYHSDGRLLVIFLK